jgi:alpha-D-ribose 1-methylphosphonate 5-triphosphate synthase subunit PhnL
MTRHPIGDPMLSVRGLGKSFIHHGRGGVELPVFADVGFDVARGECVALTGHSGSGKSTLLRCLYGNYAADAGSLWIWHQGAWVDLAQAAPREVLSVRRETLGHVSQFLRVIPRVAAIDLVGEPLRRLGHPVEDARAEAARWLARLDLPERLWSLPPATFSGGEQQRVNIARGLIARRPILLLDEPTASLDADNRQRVIDLVREALDRGAAVVGIFHDAEVRDQLATRRLDLEACRVP